MKPKPFSELNHFTVPVTKIHLLQGGTRDPHCAGAGVAAMRTLRETEIHQDSFQRYWKACLKFWGTTTATGVTVARLPRAMEHVSRSDSPRENFFPRITCIS